MGDSDRSHASTDRFRLLLGTWRSLVGKIDPTSSRLTCRVRALYWISSAVHSMLWQVQIKSLVDQLDTTTPPAPLFVLGFWRSGTTLLHELLCCDVRFGFPSTYACLNPTHFLLSERWIRSRAHPRVRRPMDDLRYSWESPQEDEFALLALGAPSAYEALIVPSLMRDIDQLLDLRARPGNGEDRWCRMFDCFVKLLTIQQGKTMVLKSPAHGYRLHVLQRKFPKARYVLIERNPYEVFASNLKLWRTLIARYGLESCSERQLEEFILAAYVLHQNIVSERFEHATPGSIAQIRYEDLVKNPLEQMHGLYKALGLEDFETARTLMEAHMASASGHTRNRLRLSREQKMRIDAAWGDIITRKGYSWPDRNIDFSDDATGGQ